jgi:hypothetical protein
MWILGKMREALNGASKETSCDTWWHEMGIIDNAPFSVIYVYSELCEVRIREETLLTRFY